MLSAKFGSVGEPALTRRHGIYSARLRHCDVSRNFCRLFLDRRPGRFGLPWRSEGVSYPSQLSIVDQYEFPRQLLK